MFNFINRFSTNQAVVVNVIIFIVDSRILLDEILVYTYAILTHFAIVEYVYCIMY